MHRPKVNNFKEVKIKEDKEQSRCPVGSERAIGWGSGVAESEGGYGKDEISISSGVPGFWQQRSQKGGRVWQGVDERRRDKRYEIPRSLLPLRHVSHTKRSDKCARFARWALAFS